MSKKIAILIIINLIFINLLQMYIKVSFAEGNGVTYYISASGISNDGTNIDNPMSIDVAKTKKYISNDKILFKSGDIFYGQVNFNISAEKGKEVLISSYGEGKLPIISGAKILNRELAWALYDENNSIYRIDLTNINNLDGIKTKDSSSCNIGFLEDSNDNKYYNRKQSLEKLSNEFDFYCDDKQYLYFKCIENPYTLLGELKATTRIDLIKLNNNIIVSNLNVSYTSAHGMSKKDSTIDNVKIENCIIENIGGGVQIEDTFTKYGNGIEFWNQGSNIRIYNNIFREIYDAGFTIQGNTITTGFENVECNNNIFESCTYPVEISCRNKDNKLVQIGIRNCEIYNNIIIDQGRGWGYIARPDKDSAADFVLWGLEGKYKYINIYNNIKYNSLKNIYLYGPRVTSSDFKKSIISDYNKIFMNNDSTLVNKNGSFYDRNILKEYGAELNSQFSLINIESKEHKEIIDIAAKSDDINEIRSIVLYNTGIYKKDGKITIRYINANDNSEILHKKEISGLRIGTYGVVAREVNGYKVIGNSSCILSLDEVNNSPEIIFKYLPENDLSGNIDSDMWSSGMKIDEDVTQISDGEVKLEVPENIEKEVQILKNEKIENAKRVEQDNTIINSILPDTGNGIIINIIILFIILFGTYSGINYYKIKKQTNKQI